MPSSRIAGFSNCEAGAGAPSRSRQVAGLVVHAMPGGAMLVDADALIVEVNGEAARLLRRTPESLINLPLADLLPSLITATGARYRAEDCAVLGAMREQRAQPARTLGVVVHGHPVTWIATSTSPFEHEGRLTGLVLIAMMETTAPLPPDFERIERLRIELSQQVSPVGTWDWSVATRSGVLSDEAYRMLGLQPRSGPITEAEVLAAIHPEDREPTLRAYGGAIANRNVYSGAFRVIWPNGETRFVDTRGEIIANEAGHPSRMLGTMQDITDRVRSQAAVQSSEQRFRAFVTQSTEGIWCVGVRPPVPTDLPAHEQVARMFRDGFMLECNDVMAHMYGHDRADELMGAAISDLLIPDDPHNKDFLLAFVESGYRLTDAETHERDKHGDEKWFLNNLVGIIEDGRLVGAWGTQRDITSIRTAEEALRKSAELLRIMLRELDHRVRNNLAALEAMVSISAQGTRSLADFSAAIRSRIHAMSVTHGLLSEQRWKSLDFCSLLDSLVPDECLHRVNRRGPAIRIPPTQCGALGMVLQELIANSLKYGSLSDLGRVEVRWTSAPVHAHDEGTPGTRLNLEWDEFDGPHIATTPAPGTGTGLIEGFVRSELSGEVTLRYPETGASHRIAIVLRPENGE